jgi:hypothetical protein
MLAMLTSDETNRNPGKADRKQMSAGGEDAS